MPTGMTSSLLWAALLLSTGFLAAASGLGRLGPSALRGRALQGPGVGVGAGVGVGVGVGMPPMTAPPNATGDTVGLGETCMVGGNLMPVLCGPGLFCDLGQPARGGDEDMATWDPDAAVNGTCRPLNETIADVFNGTAAAGEACSVGGNMMPVFCQSGLFCDIVAGNGTAGGSNGTAGGSNSTAGGSNGTSAAAQARMMGASWNPDAADNGTCKPINASSGAEGQPCVVGGNMTVSCQAGLFCDMGGAERWLMGEDSMPGDEGGHGDHGGHGMQGKRGGHHHGGMPDGTPGPGPSGHGLYGPGVGVCLAPRGPGEPCFAHNATSGDNATAADEWSWGCAEGLTCLMLDPCSFSDPGNSSAGGGTVQSRMDSNGGMGMPGMPGWPFQLGGGDGRPHRGALAGLCVKASALPEANPGAAPGSLGAECELGGASSAANSTSNSTGVGACGDGFTCVDGSGNFTITLPTGSTGVCANTSDIVNTINRATEDASASPSGTPPNAGNRFTPWTVVVGSVAVLVSSFLL